jgi:hypothetical protein
LKRGTVITNLHYLIHIITIIIVININHHQNYYSFIDLFIPVAWFPAHTTYPYCGMSIFATTTT